MTYSYERFLNGMALRTSEQVTLNNIGYETIELYREEMDEQFFTEEEFKVLPDVCMVTAINYWTKERNEYLMMDVYDESNQNHVKTIWVKNGEVQLENE
ncbi:hypothetical protein [Rummeliibacillus stabekisii]|uniref:hypothetical protein n=1 Tax=Rummeliibacillus stabekisii TaxID=241244 RepID=UPI00116F95A4|nr:hypothetical protein [Rummeliibacillus stabekisii]MBB5170419.1 hypothetical protein [Rummeliibacillus stabekisii]GEL04677.1 hypothetical protein RST01_13040 [Rummeliibacillus stabekisii]